MDLLSSTPYWRLQNGLIKCYPTLLRDHYCEVVIVGGGISGAILAYFMIESGFDTILIDGRDIGAGSTSGSTALIQYEADYTITELTKKIGAESAINAYRACFESLKDLEKISKKVGHKEFKKRKSVYLASSKKDAKMLEQENDLRKKLGLPCEYIQEKEISRLFPFSRIGALTTNHAAQLDPYLLTHQILKYCVKKGLKVFDRTRMKNFSSDQDKVEVALENGSLLSAKNLILATGYECAKYLPKKLVQLHSSYALVTKPLNAKDYSQWHKKSLIWETKKPYIYMRTLRDKRVLIGGLDEPFYNPEKRDCLLPEKKAKLEKELKNYFPDINFETAYSWAGTFAETRDGLAYIDRIPKHPNCFLSCGYGGNGITFSAVGAKIVRDMILGQKNPYAKAYSFSR